MRDTYNMPNDMPRNKNLTNRMLCDYTKINLMYNVSTYGHCVHIDNDLLYFIFNDLFTKNAKVLCSNLFDPPH